MLTLTATSTESEC